MNHDEIQRAAASLVATTVSAEQQAGGGRGSPVVGVEHARQQPRGLHRTLSKDWSGMTAPGGGGLQRTRSKDMGSFQSPPTKELQRSLPRDFGSGVLEGLQRESRDQPGAGPPSGPASGGLQRTVSNAKRGGLQRSMSCVQYDSNLSRDVTRPQRNSTEIWGSPAGVSGGQASGPQQAPST